MQNFTLGKKGISMLFFTLFLLIGSSSIFGQCPTSVGTPSPQDFCYLQTVGEITRDGSNTAVFQTADVVNDTQPIPPSEILADGEVYYVGDQAGSCSRIPVTANVNSENYPDNTLYPGNSSFTISPCSDTMMTGNDLADLFIPKDANYEIKVYTGEFNNSEITTGNLTPNDSYFVGQVAKLLGNTPQGTNCPSTRVAVGYRPTNAPAPVADSPQTFCQGATVGDLQAQGTSSNTQAIRWYRTATSTQPLNDDTILINGQSYYATQIINDRNSPFPPCESQNRTKVDVTLTGPQDLGGPYNGIVCEDDVETTFPSVDEIRKFYIALLGNVVPNPSSGTLNPTAAQLAQMYQNDADGLGDFTTTYTYGSGNCASSVDITVSIIPREDAEAGTIEDIDVPCNSTDIVVLDDSILSPDATTGGTFTGEGVNADGNFDPATVGQGTYIITYTVDDTADCVTSGTQDSTTFNIIVGNGNNGAGNSNSATVCETDVQATFPSVDEIRKFYLSLLDPGVDRTGTLNPTASQLADMYSNDPDGLGDFTTTYTLNNGGCESSVELTVSIVPTKDAEAGTIEDINVPCGSTEVVVLDDSILSPEATKGGTFSGEGVNNDGNFDPAIGPGTYQITYSVDDTAECTTPGTQDSTTFDIIVGSGNSSAGNSNSSTICKEDVQATFPSVDAIRKYYLSLLDPGVSRNGTLNPTAKELAAIYQKDADGLGDFTTTYTLNSGGCESTTQLTVSVIPTEDANAGTIEDIQVPCENSDIVVLDDSILSPDATTGGTFSGEGVNNDGNFDPAIGPGTYVITYSVNDSANCVTPGSQSSTTFDIAVGDNSVQVGTPVNIEMCITEANDLLNNPQNVANYFNNIIENQVDPNLDGEFTVQPTTLATQIGQYISNPNSASESFGTNYSYSTSCGTNSTDITLTINNTTQADAGDIENFDVCESDEKYDLQTRLTEDNPKGGKFSDESGNVIENGMLDISEVGKYNITYTVSESDIETCLTGSSSTDFEVNVTENTINIGNANMGIVCQSDVQTTFPSVDEIRKYLIRLLDPEVSKTKGTFSPTAAQLAQQYQNDADGFGDFTTTYTIKEGNCQASVNLTIRILESLDTPVADSEQSFCLESNSTISDLEVEGQNITWYEDSTLTTVAKMNDILVDGADYYAVSISTDEDICNSKPAKVIVKIITDAPAPEADASQVFCSESNPTVADLIISGEKYTVYEDADLTLEATSTDTLIDGEDYYAVAFCGSDATMITVLLGSPAPAPTGENQVICLANNPDPKVSDLVVTGENIVWYTDENLTITAEMNDPLLSGSYYAVSTTNGCTSEATKLEVLVDDSLSPVLPGLDGNKFCRKDKPRVSDLISRLNGENIRVYETLVGGEALNVEIELSNGKTYYASAQDSGSNCESSERLPITVDIAFCGIPEGFSPNEDGINDRFVIPDIREDYPNFRLEVYNRWEKLVYKGGANLPDWDGTSNQSAFGDGVLPVGYYFYILYYNDGQTEPVQGKVYLSR